MKKFLVIALLLISFSVYGQNSSLAVEQVSTELTDLRGNLEAVPSDPNIDDLVASALAELDAMDQSTADMVAAMQNANTSNAQLKSYLDESQRALARMKVGLDQVSERMQESNEWLAAAYEDLDAADAKIAMMKVAAEIRDKQLARVPINSVWHVANGVVFGSGLTMMIIQKDISADPWIGRGLVIAGAASEAFWWIGHLLFEWW
jgi:hypothetical protein